MSEGIAIVIAAGISVGGMVITVIANLIFDCRRGKAASREKFFYEIYPKRLEVYEDVLNFLSDITNDDYTLKPVPAEKIWEAIHVLDGLLNRLALYGSKDSKEPVKRLRETMESIFDKSKLKGDKSAARDFKSHIKLASDAFTNLVRKETRANFVDKEIVRFLGDAGIEEEGSQPETAGNEAKPGDQQTGQVSQAQGNTSPS